MEDKGRIGVRTVATRGGPRNIHTTPILTPRRGEGRGHPWPSQGWKGLGTTQRKLPHNPVLAHVVVKTHKLLGYTTKYTGMAIYSQLSRARTLAHI